ncbi:hypothetical protein L0Y59_04000 [Candidatus Uhrbacteria bacterium]|nr:hypothetical protein [Candidatus Uhrbacteria bacterium]
MNGIDMDTDSLRKRLKAKRDAAALQLIEGKTPSEAIQVMGELIEDAVRNGFEDPACAYLDACYLAIGHAAVRADVHEGVPDDGTRACAAFAKGIWLRTVAYAPLFRVRRSLVDVILKRWRVTPDENEAFQLFSFLLGIHVEGDEENVLLKSLRSTTDSKLAVPRLIRSFRVLKTAVVGGLEWSSWVQGVCRTIAIATVRNCTFDQTRIMFDALGEQLAKNGNTRLP